MHGNHKKHFLRMAAFSVTAFVLCFAFAGMTATAKADKKAYNKGYRALRKGIMDFERRQIYRGPEKFVDLPSNAKELDEAVDDAERLADHGTAQRPLRGIELDELGPPLERVEVQ